MKGCLIGLAIIALSGGTVAQQPAPDQSDKSAPIIRSVSVMLPTRSHPYFIAGVSFPMIRQAWREHNFTFVGSKLNGDDIEEAKEIILDLYKAKGDCVTVDHKVTLMSEGSVRLAFSARKCRDSDPAAIANH